MVAPEISDEAIATLKSALELDSTNFSRGL